MNFSTLPRALSDTAQLHTLVTQAQEKGQTVSLLLGLPPKSGCLPPLDSLVPLEWAPNRLYLGLFDGTLPTESLPSNLLSFTGNLHELLAALGHGFAVEAVSVVGVDDHFFAHQSLLDLHSALAPRAALHVYLHCVPGSKSHQALVQRMTRTGFVDIRTTEVAKNARLNTVRILVSATAKNQDLPSLDPQDPLVVELTKGLTEQGPDTVYVLACAVAWLRHVCPLTPEMLHDLTKASRPFARTWLRAYPETDGQRDKITRKVSAVIATLCHRLKRFDWRLVPLAAEMMPAAWINEQLMTQLDDLLADMTDRIRPSTIWEKLRVRTKLPKEDLRKYFHSVVTTQLWRHWEQLQDPTRKALIEALPADLPGLRTLGYEPPYQHLPVEEKLTRLHVTLHTILQDATTPIPPRETIAELHRRLLAQGIPMTRSQFEGIFSHSKLADVLWEAAGKGILHAQFLSQQRVNKPLPAEGTTPSRPVRKQLPPPPAPSVPEKPAQKGPIGIEGELERFLAARRR